MNPYTLPNAPRVTIRQILPWIARQDRPVTPPRLAARFGMTEKDADSRLRKLHGWHYLRRRKERAGAGSWPRFVYWPSAFGKRTAKKWGKG